MIPLRLARELTYQLEHAGEHERLAKALSDPFVFLSSFQPFDRSTTLSTWKRLSGFGYLPERYYDNILQRLHDKKISFAPFLIALNGFYFYRGEMDRCLGILVDLNRQARATDNRKLELDCMYQLAKLESNRDNAETAMKYAKRAMELGEALEEPKSVSHIMGIMGNIYHRQQNMDEALKHHIEHYRMAELLGDREGMAVALTNIGTNYNRLNRYPEAISYLERSWTIKKTLGNRELNAGTLGNLGNAYAQLGQFEKAIAYYTEQLSIAESLDLKLDIGLACGNLAGSLLSMKDFDRSLKLFQRALEAHRYIQYWYAVTYWHQGIALASMELAGERNDPDRRNKEAREHALECLTISERIAKKDTQIESKIILARLDAMEGNVAIAVQNLEALCAGISSEEHRASLEYWIWKIAGAEEHRMSALRSYESLWLRTRKFEFRQHLAELNGERVPTSADDIEEVA